MRLCSRKSQRDRERRNAENPPRARLCTSGFHFHLLFIFPSRHCNPFSAVRLWEFNQCAPDPTLSELWGREVGCPFCYTSPSTSFLPKNAHVSSAQLHLWHSTVLRFQLLVHLFSNYLRGTVLGSRVAVLGSHPVPALMACQLIQETSLHSTNVY